MNALPKTALRRARLLGGVALVGAAGWGAIAADGATADAAPRLGPAVSAVAGLGLPGPAPRARPHGADVASANAACEKCHADIAAEWRGSMHQQAWIDPVFQEAYDIGPLAFCRGCHAPEADAESMPSA